MCYLCGVAARRRAKDSRGHHPGAGREDMDGTLPCKFHQASCGCQFGTEGIALRKTLGAHNNYAGTIFHFQAADRPIRLPVKRVRKS